MPKGPRPHPLGARWLILEEEPVMAGSEKETICYEAASWLEHDLARSLIDSGAALAARIRRALERLPGFTSRRRADGAHRRVTRSR
jgi:hypothetical protein